MTIYHYFKAQTFLYPNPRSNNSSLSPLQCFLMLRCCCFKCDPFYLRCDARCCRGCRWVVC
ncbi:hypothetical protein BT96DRAFT_915759, partial [Gymnopus androsaceus JB14]